MLTNTWVPEVPVARVIDELEDLKRQFGRAELESLAASEGLVVTNNHRMQCPVGCGDDSRRATVGEQEGVGVWNCHGCKLGGTAIDLLRYRRQVDVSEAVRVLKELVGRLPPPPVRIELPRKDGRALWARLAEHDLAGEHYLGGRGLGEAVHRGLVRFNIGNSGDDWLDSKAHSGYRVAFPLFDTAGHVVSFQLRAVVDAKPAKLSLMTVPTAGLAFGSVVEAAVSRRVFVTEGIADTIGMMLVADCVVGADGEGKLSSLVPFFGSIAGREFVLCPQNDVKEQSQKAFAGLADSLRAAGGLVRLLVTPEAYRDPAEWLQAVGLEQLKAAVDSSFQMPVPSMGTTRVAEPNAFVATETGLAEEFVKRRGFDYRFCGDWQRWFAWDGRRWELNTDASVQRAVIATIRDLRADAAHSGDEKRTDYLFKAERCTAREHVEKLARYEAPVQLRYKQLDAAPMLLNCSNGTVDLATGTLLPHRREDLLTKLAPVDFDPSAPCPLWEAFLDRIFDADRELIDYVQRAVGYSLTADVGAQVFFILWGSGANGKSTFLTTLMHLLGDYSRAGVADMLIAKSSDRHPTEYADLFGSRLVVFQETTDGLRFDEAKVKALTGGDRIKTRRMREDFWEFDPTHKLWLGTNHRPAVRGTDHAIWRRIHLVPFTVTIPAEERDPQLLSKLRRELPGILSWAVRGCVDWQRGGLRPPSKVLAAVEEYKQSEDRLAAFLADCCCVGPDKVSTSKDLYGAYKTWAADTGEFALSAKAFGQRLLERGFTPAKVGNRNERAWKGVGILTQPRS